MTRSRPDPPPREPPLELGGEQELTAISSEKVPGTAAKGGSFTVTAHRAPPGFGARSAAFNNRRKRETKMRPIREEEDETRLRGRERERGRERTRKEELKQAQGRKKEKAGVVFDHYGVGFSLLLPLLRRRSLPASPPSLLLLLLLIPECGGWWPDLARWLHYSRPARLTAHSRPARLAPVCRLYSLRCHHADGALSCRVNATVKARRRRLGLQTVLSC